MVCFMGYLFTLSKGEIASQNYFSVALQFQVSARPNFYKDLYMDSDGEQFCYKYHIEYLADK